ncbi:hypothetical protein ACFQT0_00750 [Hymenobacter humi]|uniref:Uncharacterized protein n=1 Tax=Hymenobacter humi TaxID=1411620 RepID=A0ABW2TZS6_9BACT
MAIPAAPTAASLKNLSVYIIVDPDTRKETPSPTTFSPTTARPLPIG